MRLSQLIQHRRYSRGYNRRRFYTDLDMAIVKLDAAIRNSRIRRGEIKTTNNQYIVDCGCGAEGCFIHSSY